MKLNEINEELSNEINTRIENLKDKSEYSGVLKIRGVINGMASIREDFTKDELLTLVSTSLYLIDLKKSEDKNE